MFIRGFGDTPARHCFFFFSLSRFGTLLIFVFRTFFRQGTRQPYAKPSNSGGDMPAALLRRERQGRGSISSPSSRSKSSTPRSASITPYHCYQYPLRRHVGKPLTKHSAKKDQEARPLRSASTAGFFCSLAMETNRRDRQAPILSLYANLCTVGTRAKVLSPSKGFRRDFQASSTTARVHRGGARAVALIVAKKNPPSSTSTSPSLER